MAENFSEAFGTDPAPCGDQSGADVLDDVAEFLARFIAYPSFAALVAHTLWIAHAHLMDCWESTPRIAFLSPEPGSGKTRALEVTEPLVPRPVHAVNATSAYLFRKVSDPDGPPTVLYDEIDTLFGPKARDNEDVRGMLNAGHRRGAMAGRCATRGKTVVTEELPAYCAVALAGLYDLPDTIMTRSVVVRMRKRSASERIEPWRLRVQAATAEKLRIRLEEWTAIVAPDVAGGFPDLPVGIEDRDADVWEALIAVADAAGGHWPETARAAALALVADPDGKRLSLGVRLLADLHGIYERHGMLAPNAPAESGMPSELLVDALVTLEEAPWATIDKGKPLSRASLARRLRKYGVKSDQLWHKGTNQRGYKTLDLLDPWSRYVTDTSGPSPSKSARSARTARAASEVPTLGTRSSGPSTFRGSAPHADTGSQNEHARSDSRGSTSDDAAPVPRKGHGHEGSQS